MHETDHPTVTLAQRLIQQPSITPDDQGCQDIIADFLKPLGFDMQDLPFGDVRNLWACRGTTEPVLVFAGHTDVVPSGPVTQWSSDPFTANIVDDKLIGRGAADMKGAIAAMMIATQRFLKKHPEHTGSIAFLITSDEEGPAINGTAKVIEYLQQQKQTMNWCIVGEASSENTVGDSIKVGRRGSLHATLTVTGKQGHIAYPDRVCNPIPTLAAFLAQLSEVLWDEGDAHFPPTTCQTSIMHAGDGTENLVPGTATAQLNWRFSPASTVQSIEARTEEIVSSIPTPDGITWHIDWRVAAEPFGNASKNFLDKCDMAIQKITGAPPQHSTSGGTSDGRFIAPTGCQVIELGVLNHSIHQIDEQVSIKDLIILTDLYETFLEQLF